MWVSILDRLSPFELAITPAQVFARVLPTVIAPLVVGLVVRTALPRIADVAGRMVHYFFLLALAVAIVAAIYLGAPVFLDVAPRTYLAGLIIVMRSRPRSITFTPSARRRSWGGATADHHIRRGAAAVSNPLIETALALHPSWTASFAAVRFDHRYFPSPTEQP